MHVASLFFFFLFIFFYSGSSLFTLQLYNGSLLCLFQYTVGVHHWLIAAWSFLISSSSLTSLVARDHTPHYTHTDSLKHSHDHFPSSCYHLSPFLVQATRRSSNSKSHCSYAIAGITPILLLWKAHHWWNCYCVAFCLAAPPRYVE